MVYLFGLLIAAVVINVLRKFLHQAAASMTPPARIQLVSTSPSKRHTDNVEKNMRDLETRGFRKLGTFRVDPMKGVMLTAFAHPEQSLCAIVYTHPLAGSFVDMVAKTENDRSLTVTTAPVGAELDRREGQEKLFDRSLSIAGMYDIVVSKRPEGPYVAWNAGNFARKFEEAYAKEMSWRTSRGGATHEEVRRLADATGRKFSDEQVETARRSYQEKLAAAHRESH